MYPGRIRQLLYLGKEEVGASLGLVGYLCGLGCSWVCWDREMGEDSLVSKEDPVGIEPRTVDAIDMGLTHCYI